jgi:uncharacterized protein (DUF952 family)
MHGGIMKKTHKYLTLFLMALSLSHSSNAMDQGKEPSNRTEKEEGMKISLHNNAIYKIVLKSDFNEANIKNCVKLSKLDKTSGFIHASYGSQVKKTIEKFYKNRNDVLVLELDIDVLKTHGIMLKPEANKSGGTVYPHFYGKQEIPSSAIKRKIHF